MDLIVTSSTFTCEDLDYNEDVIMTNNIDSAYGRPSLFRLGQASKVEVLPLLEVEATGSSGLPDGFLDATFFNLTFS